MRVVLTRTKEDIQKDRHLFEKEGLKVVELPLIEEVVLEFELPKERFDYIVFQSPRSARVFLSRYRPEGERLVAVGEKTKRVIESYGYEVFFFPEEYYSKALLEFFRGKGGRVLVPRSSVGRVELIEGLEGLGFEVKALDVYTVKPMLYQKGEVVEKLASSEAIFFASPSAIDGLLANLQKEEAMRFLKAMFVVCIGKTTKEHLQRTVGVEALMPEKPSVEHAVALLKDLAQSLQK